MRPEVLTDVIYEVASACGSSGWVIAVLALHQWEVRLLADDVVAEIWGEDPSMLLSSAYAPTGEVRPAEGGFVLSGRWPFSSGCDHAQWAILGGVRPPAGAGRAAGAVRLLRAAHGLPDRRRLAHDGAVPAPVRNRS